MSNYDMSACLPSGPLRAYGLYGNILYMGTIAPLRQCALNMAQINTIMNLKLIITCSTALFKHVFLPYMHLNPY